MKLSKTENAQFRKLMATCESILSKSSGAGAKKAASTRGTKPKRVRRLGEDLAAFRKLIMSERKRGVPVSELAKKHGVTSAYIYMLK
jgi:hypothetical protein